VKKEKEYETVFDEHNYLNQIQFFGNEMMPDFELKKKTK
jgi:hypothetical protein